MELVSIIGMGTLAICAIGMLVIESGILDQLTSNWKVQIIVVYLVRSNMNILDLQEAKMKKTKDVGLVESNPLAEFFELCIQSGLQFENSERANMLDKAIDFAIEKRVI